MTDDLYHHFNGNVDFQGIKIPGPLEKKVQASVINHLNTFLEEHLFGEELDNIEPTKGLTITIDDSPHRLYIGYADWVSSKSIHCTAHYIESDLNGTEYQQLHVERVTENLRITLDALVDQSSRESESLSVYSTGGGSKSELIAIFHIAGERAGELELPAGALEAHSHARTVLAELHIDIDKLEGDSLCKDEVLQRFRNMLFDVETEPLE